MTLRPEKQNFLWEGFISVLWLVFWISHLHKLLLSALFQQRVKENPVVSDDSPVFASAEAQAVVCLQETPAAEALW